MNSEPQPVYVAAPARVPQGLAAAVEGLTREVIRQQPDNIYMFAAQHFDKLLRLRQQYDNCGAGGGNQAPPSGVRGDNCQSRAQDQAADMQATSKQTQTKSTMTKKSYMTTTTCMTTSRTTTTLKSNNNGNDACTATRLSKIPQATSGVGGGGYETTKEYSKEMTSRKCTTSNNNQAWSLDETAKVLERHRSIFGISGQKMSTEEVRELASKEQQQQQQQQQQQSQRFDRHYACKYGVPQPSRGPSTHQQQTSSKVVSQDYQSSCIRHSRHSPKIISQIPLARDMKTELRRNRQRNCDGPLAASHCRIASSSCSRNEEYRRHQHHHHHHHHHRERSARGHHGSCERIDSCGSRCRNYEQATRRPCKHTQTSSKRQQQQQQQPNFLVRNLGSMPSLEELQPPSYLRRVQQVVDETSTPLRQKIEALKVNQSQGERVGGGGRIGSIERSLSTEDEPFRSDGLQLFDRHRHSETIGKASGNGKHVLRRSASTQSLGRSSSNYGYRSDESKISLPIVSASNGNVHGQQQSGAHPSAASAAASSLQSSRSVSAHSNSEAESHADVVLPPISPESSKSQKLPDEQLVLPTLPTPQGSGGSDKEMDLDEDDDDDEEDRQIMELLRVNNEEDFKDSLNVTPDPRNVAPQRPDSLETSDLENDARQRDNEDDEPASPVDTLKGKLLEIEQVSKRIESVLVENNKNELANNNNNAKSKLIDDRDSTTENLLLNDDIKRKLLELEDVERRIDGIFVAGGGGGGGAGGGTVKSHKGYVIQDKDSGVQGSVASEPSFDKRQESHEGSCSGGESARNEDAVSPSSYILTEGSPCDIPDSVITVIIPDNRPTSPDSDVCTQIEYDNPDSRLRQRKEQQQQQQRTENESRANSAVSSGNASEHVFGELIDHRGDTELAEAQLATGSDIDFLRAIKANHDELVARQELSLIREEDNNNRPDSDDEKVLRVVTSSLEDILEDKQQEQQEVVVAVTTTTTTTAVTTTGEYESTDETKESSMTTDGLVERTEEVVEVTSLTTGGSVESSNEFKETSVTTDRSSLSLDPAMPYVPELNLDSLPDLTSSSIIATTTDDDEQAPNVSPDTLEKSPSDDNGDNNDVDEDDDNNDEEQVEIEEYEKLEQSLKSPPAIDESSTDVIQASEAVVNNNNNNVNDAMIVVDVEHRNAADDEGTTTTISENRRASASDDCTTRTAAASTTITTTTTITAMTSAAMAVTATQRMQQRAATSQNDDDDLSSSATTAAATTAATEIENNNICNESPERQQQSSSQRTAAAAAAADAAVEDISIKSKIDTENERGESSSAQLAEATGQESLQLTSLSITETSSFIHAVTKIQSGVRGFLARRRAFKLQHQQQQQRSECRSSTLDSVPSIQESFVADAIAVATATAAVAATAAAIETSFVGIVDEIDNNAPTSGNHNNKENNKTSKKRLTREDAVMRTTLSVENAFAENQLQHTGEFHDCIPLPVFGADDLDLKIKRPVAAALNNAATPPAHVVQELLGKLLQADAALLLHATTAPTARPVDPLLHAGYLNFITSVEDMGHVVEPTTPTSKGVVIEEITGTSLDDEQILRQLDDTTGSQVSNEEDSSSNVVATT